MNKLLAVPKVAVLLAAYNGEKWIEEQVVSILNQKHVNVTLYISVDLSVDNTFDLVEKMGLDHSNIITLHYGGHYGSAAANFFRLIDDIDFSCYDYIAFSDQDDIWLDMKLERAVLKLGVSECAAYSSDATAFWPDGKERLLKKSYKQCKYDHFFESPGPGCTFVFKSSVLQGFQLDFKSISHFSAQVTTNHDWYLYAYVRQKGLTWYIDDCPTIRYRQHSNNVMGVNSGIKNYVSRIKMVRSQWYRKQVEVVVESFAPELKHKLLNRFFLIFNFHKLRRRPRDRIALLFMLLFGLF